MLISQIQTKNPYQTFVAKDKASPYAIINFTAELNMILVLSFHDFEHISSQCY